MLNPEAEIKKTHKIKFRRERSSSINNKIIKWFFILEKLIKATPKVVSLKTNQKFFVSVKANKEKNIIKIESLLGHLLEKLF